MGPITDFRIDMRRAPEATIAAVVEAYKRLGDNRLVADELKVKRRTFDRAVHDFPALAEAIQEVREARLALG